MRAGASSTWTVWLSLMIPFGIFYASVYGPEAALFCELFDARIRYTGISFVYQFSGIFFSGLTPIIATALLKINGGSPTLMCIYVAASGVVSAASAVWIGRHPTVSATPTASQLQETELAAASR